MSILLLLNERTEQLIYGDRSPERWVGTERGWHVRNLSVQEAEAGTFRVQGQPELHDPGKKVGSKTGRKMYAIWKNQIYMSNQN